MSRKEDFTYPQVGIDKSSEAWADVLSEADDYGISPGEFIRVLVVSWSKMKRGQWNPLWGQTPIFNNNGAAPIQAQPEKEAERIKREEAERRKRIRLAAAQAEADELE